MCLTEKWVNMLGIVSVVVGTAVAIMVGMATDRIKGYMKITIMLLLGLGIIEVIIILTILKRLNG